MDIQDVYKRQVLVKLTAFHVIVLDENYREIVPVSYTHLDVYKRQGI